MSMEERSSTEDASHNESSASITDQNSNAQQPESPGPSESAGSPEPSSANELASEQKPETSGSSASTNSPAATTAPESTSAQQPKESAPGGRAKNPAAVSLGRLGGLKGGKARAKSLTTAQRSEAARKAALARWQKKKKKAE